MLTISPIPAFSDNYIWCLADSRTGKALVVDPGQAAPVEEHLDRHGLLLDTILVTHHHQDHVGGITELRKQHPACRVTVPAESPFRAGTDLVRDGDSLLWQGIRFQVIGVPGHTLDHVAYFSDQTREEPLLFCGDTLFVCGCGRLFEGSPAQMRQSLQRLRSLPDDTRVYCAHEYTLANLKFARNLLPENNSLERFGQHCQELRDAGKPTVPARLGDEKRMNPFLRWDDPEVIRAITPYAQEHHLPVSNDDEVFAAIRHAKDHF